MRRELKVIVDTNIIVSAAIGKSSTFRKIYNAFVNGLFTPVLSPLLQGEILNVIKKPHLKRYFHAREIRRFKELIRVDTILVLPTTKVSLCRDPKDDVLLETAIEAKANFIVTSDKDLLSIKSFSGIPIIAAHQFLRILKKL